jgi:hypothetical protein
MSLGIVGATDPRKTLSCPGRLSPPRYISVKHREAIAEYHYCCAVVTRFRRGGIPTLGVTLTATLRSDLFHNFRSITYIYHISYHTSYNFIPYHIYRLLYHIILYRILSNHIRSYIISYISCRTIPYYTISYHIISYHIISYHIISYHIIYHIIYHISYHIIYHIIYILCHVMSCHVMSCHVMSCHVISCHVMPCHIMSCHVMSYHIMSYHIIYRTIPYHVSYRISAITHWLTPVKCPIWTSLLRNRWEIFRYFIPKHLQYKEKLGKCLCGETFEVNVAVGLLHKLPWTVFVEADPLLRGTNMSQEQECCWTGIHGNSADKRERKWTIFKGLEW